MAHFVGTGRNTLVRSVINTSRIITCRIGIGRTEEVNAASPAVAEGTLAATSWLVARPTRLASGVSHVLVEDTSAICIVEVIFTPIAAFILIPMAQGPKGAHSSEASTAEEPPLVAAVSVYASLVFT